MTTPTPRPARPVHWPFTLRAYALAARLSAPLIAARVTRRLSRAGVAPARLPERRGRATLPRPDGALIWLHGASVGETLSILPLVARLTAAGHPCLVTAGTATAAELLGTRLPPGALHQFAPLDAPQYLARFLDHWRPAAAVMVESELWPNSLRALDQRAIPRLLLNARLSPRSLRRWAARAHLARAILGGFTAIVAQSPDTFNALTTLGITPDRLTLGGNLKAGASAPPHDAATLARLHSALGPRPRWAAVSTHDGEEDAALQAHAHILRHLPDACLILCPRHPARGDQIAALVAAHGLTLTRRSAGQDPGAQVYLADSLGETGLWFRLAPVTFLGGSLTPQGGHNPWEPAACGSALLTGPHLDTIRPDMEKLTAVNFSTVLPDAAALGPAVLDLLADPAQTAARGAAGRAAQAQASGSLDQATALILSLIR